MGTVSGAETNTKTGTKTNTKTNAETADKIIKIMKEQPAIAVREIAEQLGLSVSGVRYHINKMKKDGMVEYVGSSKKGAWSVHRN